MIKTFISSKWFAIGLLGLALWFTPEPSYGQSKELVDAANQSVALHGQGRYDEAVPFGRKAVRLGEREFGTKHPFVASLLDNLAQFYYFGGRYAEAEPLYKRAIRIDEKALGPDHPGLATDLENYAALLRATNRPDEAEELETRAAAIRERQAE